MCSHAFKKGDIVVYPSHGAAKITTISIQKIGGIPLEFYQISFEKDKMSLSIPVSRAKKIGLRALCTTELIDQGLQIICGKANSLTGMMWSHKARKFEEQINSGNILEIAEVIRDLHKNLLNPDRSYSERMIYERAYSMFATEASYVRNISCEAFGVEFKSMFDVDENDFDDSFNDDDDDDDQMIAA
jgi:CarD family transcriptional regulator